MKKTIRSIKALLASGLMLTGLLGNAQQWPGPYQTDYAFGYKPSGITDAVVTDAYTKWKAGYLVDAPSCAGTAKRVKFDTKSGRFTKEGVPSTGADITSVSEGIAYGMLLAAYYGDKPNFDGLWSYYQKFMNVNGIMNWGINNTACTIVGRNGATDAELDVAWALYVAYHQFNNSIDSPYLKAAKDLIKAIKTHEVDKTGGLNTLKPGDQFGGHGSGDNDLVNPSYFSPAYYRVFGEITNDVAFWESVYNRGYDILEKAMNKNTGLVPDWCTSKGTTPASGAVTNGYDDNGVNFFYDGIRTPVRTAMDYLWYGDQSPRALAYTKTINNWLRAKHPDPSKIGSKYALDGTILFDHVTGHNNTFVGAFAVSAMATDDANTRTFITSLYNENVKVVPGAGEYFNASWKALSMFILSGNFYLPPPDACEGPYLEPAYHLCLSTATPKQVVLDATTTGAGKYEWKKVGSTTVIATTPTYAVKEAGLYEVSTTVSLGGGKNCVRRAATTVYAATPTASFTFTRSGLAVDFKNTSTGGDLLADPASLTSTWAYGTGATPLTSATVDGATNYSTGGSKLVTLTVKNACNVSSTYSETVALASASGPGWFATDFTTQSLGEFGAYDKTGVVNKNVAIDITNCQYAVASVKTAMDINETVTLTFKNPNSTLLFYNAPMDVTAYPFVRFRIKIETAADITKLLPNGLRVDLVSWDDKGTPTNDKDDVYTATGKIPANVVYLKGPRNADGTYQNIPTNQWFIATLSFDGKLATTAGFNPAKTLQLAFTPYNDLPNGSADRKDYKIFVDWATVGNADIPKPNPTLLSGAQKVCVDSPFKTIFGSDLDSCNASTALWSDGFTKFGRTLGVGTYSVTVSNFAGSESRTITVASSPKVKAGLTYEVAAQSPFQIQPYDNSVGDISAWRWHKAPSETATLSTTISSTNPSPNTLLFNGASTQTPQLTALSGTKAFTGSGSEYLCLVATSKIAGCSESGTTTSRACVLVVPGGPNGIEEVLNDKTFAIFPTVVTDNSLTVILGNDLKGIYDVKVLDVHGKQVLSTSATSGSKEINLGSNVIAGTYIVKVSQGDKTITKKFIKQ